MDNLARHYAATFRQVSWLVASLRIVILTQVQAEDLACEGKEEAALAICWELRLRPDLGLYRRATVNLLIAICIADKTQAPKYANECLDLLRILREQGTVAEASLNKELPPIERLAQEILQDGKAKEKVDKEDSQSESEPRSASATASLQIEGYLRDDWAPKELVEHHSAAKAFEEEHQRPKKKLEDEKKKAEASS